jgi:hypothetical protein
MATGARSRGNGSSLGSFQLAVKSPLKAGFGGEQAPDACERSDQGR